MTEHTQDTSAYTSDKERISQELEEDPRHTLDHKRSFAGLYSCL